MALKLALIIASFYFCSMAMALDLYVSPAGSDKLDGSSTVINVTTKTGPFKTLAKAQQAIRDLKTAGKFTQPITVHVGKGTYQLKTALEFNDSDSGEPGKEILWQGEKGATLITGGILLSGCQAYDATNPEQIISCPLDASVVANIQSEVNKRISGNAPKFEVFLNDYKLHLARWPNYDWAHVRKPLNEKTRFSVFEALPNFSGDLSNSRVHIFAGNDYLDEYDGVSLYDFANKQITLASETTVNIANGRRFYLENFLEGLDTPEEWFFDQATNRLLYIPPYDAIPKSLVISNVKNLINLKNTHHVSFTNLTFRHSTGNAITLTNGNNVILDGLEINNIGASGVVASNSNNITVSNSKIHDVGEDGVVMSGGDRINLVSSQNVIDNNYVYNFQTNLLNGAGVDIGGVGIQVSHNTIRYGAGTGIILRGNDHVIEKNEISQICTQAGDCGAIYSSKDWTFRGNVIRYNYIHDSYGYILNVDTLDVDRNILQYKYDSARGIYLDDGVSGFTVLGNLVVNAGLIGIQVGGGRDHIIDNNFIKTNKKSIYIDSRSPFYDWNVNRTTLTTMPINSAIWKIKYPKLTQPMANDTWPEGNKLTRNVTISTAYLGYSFRFQVPSTGNTMLNNLVWHASSDIRADYNILDTNDVKGGALWGDWTSKGIDIGSVKADPCINITGRKISLTCVNSPTIPLGIKGIPADIGAVL